MVETTNNGQISVMNSFYLCCLFIYFIICFRLGFGFSFGFGLSFGVNFGFGSGVGVGVRVGVGVGAETLGDPYSQRTPLPSVPIP